MKYILTFLTCNICLLLISSVNNVALAQLNNKAFSFNTPNGGVGMSIGGKQAILNKEILNSVPTNLVRSNTGTLLNVTKNKGGAAIVNYEGGSFIPSFRGSSFRGDHTDWFAGAFNSFFVPNNGNASTPRFLSYQTGANISTWTGRVSTNTPVSYTPNNTVDTWTGMVAYASY